MMKFVLCTLISASLSACSFHVGKPVDAYNYKTGEDIGPMELITHDNGGFARVEYPKWQARQKQHGYRGYIVNGPCVSFCAPLALYSRFSCYTSSGSLSLHLSPHLPGGKAEMQRFNDKLVSFMPEPLRPVLRAAGNNPLTGIDLTFEDLRRVWPEGWCEEKGIRWD